MEGVVVVRDDHVVFLGDLAGVAELLVLGLEAGQLELVLLDDLL